MRQRTRLPRFAPLRAPGAWALILALLIAQLLLPAAAFAEEDGADPLPVFPAEAAPAEGVPAESAAPLGQTVKLIATKDTFIASQQPGENFGGLNNLDTGWYGAFGAVRPLVKFNLSNIPGNAKVYGAQLVMYLDFALPANDGNMVLDAARATQDWSEMGATWYNAAGIGGPQFRLGSVSTQPGWASFDLTNQVQQWVNGQGNHGLMIIGDETPSLSRARIFRSHEYGGFEPYLLVNYECDTLAPVSQMGSLPANSPGVFTVTWSGQDRAPSGCQPTGIRKFKVDYSVNGGSWVDWKSTTSTSATFDNFAPNGARVDFRVYAEDNAGNVERVPSSPQASTVIVSQAPELIFNPLPAVTNAPSFTVSWYATDDPDGIANYDIQYQINGGAWTDLLIQTTQTSYQFTNAQNGLTYGFRGRARDNLGNVGSYPAAAQVQTTVQLLPSASITPFNPNIINSTSPVTTSFQVAWNGSTPPGTVISQYQVYYQVVNFAGQIVQDWSLWQTVAGTVTSATFPVNFGNAIYNFQVVATNNYGPSPMTGTQASMIVDLGDTFHPVKYMPIVARQ